MIHFLAWHLLLIICIAVVVITWWVNRPTDDEGWDEWDPDGVENRTWWGEEDK